MTWNLTRGEEFLPHTSINELKKLMKAEPKSQPKTRLLIAVHRKQNKSLDEIAQACAVTRSTVAAVLQRFQKRGLTAAHAVKQEGRPPHLTKNQRKQLLKILEKGNSRTPSKLWTSKEVLNLIKKKFNVTYTPQHVWRLLIACGFSLLVPRPRHYKSPGKEVHDAFKKKLAESHTTIEKKVLLWAAKMKPHSGYFQMSRAAGRAAAADPSRR